MKTKAKLAPAFICAGCGAEKKPDGTPKNAPFVWTTLKTRKSSQYCYDCDDKLLNDLPLPNDKK